MFTTFFSFSFFVALIHTVLAQSDFTIDSPSLVQCQSTQITWSDTSNPPYHLLIVDAQDVCGVALKDLGEQTSTAVTWTVDLAAGTQVVLYVEDAVGDEAWSGTITIGNSDDTSCLGSTPSSSPATSGTVLTLPPSGAAPTSTSPAASSPTSSAFAPAGAANAGLGPTSGAISTRPLRAVTLFGSAVLAIVAFTL